jgi:lipoyl(octanoyl) transferase
MIGTEVMPRTHHAISVDSKFLEPIVPNSFLILPFLREPAPVNMATDLWLFQDYPDASQARFRHFEWNRPSVTFGYGQDFSWVLEETKCAEVDLCRRPTGGGIVKHGGDWTYSLVFPPSHPVCEDSASEVYLHVHRAISVSLAKCGADTNLLPCKGDGCSSKPRKVIPGQCFLEPVARDVILSATDSKIAGAAIKRTRAGLLLQGTIDMQAIPDVDWHFFETLFLAELSAYLSAEPELAEWPQSFESSRKAYVEQFTSTGWLRERKATLSRK